MTITPKGDKISCKSVMSSPLSPPPHPNVPPTSFVFIDGFGQSVNGLDIQIVGGFVLKGQIGKTFHLAAREAIGKKKAPQRTAEIGPA